MSPLKTDTLVNFKIKNPKRHKKVTKMSINKINFYPIIFYILPNSTSDAVTNPVISLQCPTFPYFTRVIVSVS